MAHMHATGIGRELPPPIDVPLDAIAEISATLLRAQTFTGGNGVALTVRENGSLVCRATNGVGAPEFGARMPLEGTFLGICLATKRPQKCDDTDTDIRFENAAYGRVRPKSVLAVPVRQEGDCLAVLAVYSNSANAFTNTHIAILRTMADSLARHVRTLPVLEPSSLPARPATPVMVQSAPPAPAPVEVAPTPEPPRQAQPPAPSVPQPVRPEPVKIAEPARIAGPVAPPPASQLTPTPAKKHDEELLVLAADPGPMTVPEPVPMARPPIAAPARVFTSTFAYDIPRTLPRSSRRRRAAQLRIAMVTFAVVASTVVAAGWWKTRMPEAPRAIGAAPVAPPVVQKAPEPAIAAVTAAPAAPVPALAAAVTAPVNAGVLIANARETKAPAPAADRAAAKPAVVERAPAEPVKQLAASPKPLPTHAAEVEAPSLAMNVAPALPMVAAPAAPAPAPVAHRSQIVPATLLQRVSPQYPAAAWRMRIGGKVVLAVTIRKDGSVGDVKMTSGNNALRESAIDAVKQWRYTPAMLDGTPVDSTAEVILNFTAPK